MLKNNLYRYGNDNGRVPAHLNFAKEVYDNMVKNKDITALINADTKEQRSYGEIAQMTADLALSLTRMGVRKGEVICICSEKKLEYLPTVMGIMCAGASFAPTDPTYGSFLLLHRIKIVRPRIMFCSLSAYETHKAAFEEVGSIQHYILYGNETRDGAVLFKEFLTKNVRLQDFEAVPVNGWEDAALIVFSSGTTGLPKGIPVTHLAFLLNAQNLVRSEYTGEPIYTCREFHYTSGLLYTLACLRVGATVVFNPNNGEKAMLEAVQKYKIKLLQVAPKVVTDLIKSPILDRYDVSTVECIVSSSSCMGKQVVNAIKQRIPNLISVVQIYGMSEAGSICIDQGCAKGPRPGSSGMPCLGFVIKVVDLQTREPLGPNQRGEICFKSPGLMKGYLNNVSPDCKDEDGFLKTGDVGYYDDDGYFYLVSRIKEIIKFNDVSVTPAEFEALLLQHPSVRDAGVVGKPNPEYVEVPVAFIVLQPGSTATEEELVEHVNSQVNHKMRLEGGVRFIDRLPRGTGYKLDRKDLMRRCLDENVK